jgi:hypothetical protein
MKNNNNIVRKLFLIISEDSGGSSMLSPTNPGPQQGVQYQRPENRQPSMPLVDFVQQLEDYTPTVRYLDFSTF